MPGILTSLFQALTGGPRGPAIGAAQLQEALKVDDVRVVIDVRTPSEWSQGHVPGAVHIPLNQLGARMGELEAYAGQPVYLICRSGARSGQAQAMLAKAGIPTTNVSGGTMAWTAAGYPLE